MCPQRVLLKVFAFRLYAIFFRNTETVFLGFVFFSLDTLILGNDTDPVFTSVCDGCIFTTCE